MLFGSISYLNLLPFQVFLKKNLSNNASKMSFGYKRNIPSKINKSLQQGEIDAGFISSIASKKYRCTNLGIIANKKVYSVFILKGEQEKDPASASSNRLANILNLKGKVLIGDVALKYYLEGGEGVDLAEAWYNKTGLPFVFARLCYNKHQKYIKNISNHFIQTKVKIPQYILKREAKKRDITTTQLVWYLEYISYKIDNRASRSLKKFLDYRLV